MAGLFAQSAETRASIANYRNFVMKFNQVGILPEIARSILDPDEIRRNPSSGY